jgi:hypothetical protein
MRSSERACGASHAVSSSEAVERGRTLLIGAAFLVIRNGSGSLAALN